MSEQQGVKSWAALSDEAKGVLEWVEDVRSGRPMLLAVQEDAFPLRGGRPIPEVPHLLSAEIVREIVDYASTDDNLTMVEDNGVYRIGFHELFPDVSDTGPRA